MPGASVLPDVEFHDCVPVFSAGCGNPGSGWVQPLTWDPVTVKLGSGEGGMGGQMSMALPLMVPLAWPLSVMLPFDHTSPVTPVVDVPVKTREFPAPLQPAG